MDRKEIKILDKWPEESGWKFYRMYGEEALDIATRLYPDDTDFHDKIREIYIEHAKQSGSDNSE